jgi:hypothetical protein
MASRRNAVHFGAAVTGLALVAVAAVGTPAAASTGRAQLSWPNDTFHACSDACEGSGSGGVVWSARGARVQGSLMDFTGTGSIFYFEAYAGAVKIDSETRTASPGENLPFNFPIGDPDLVGGFDRLKIQVCLPGPSKCGPPLHAHRDGVAEDLYTHHE